MRIRVLSAFLAASLGTPALAQDGPPSPEQAEAAQEARARLSIAVGGVWLPDYEGSDDQRWIPAPAANGTVAGMSFTVLGNRASLDLIPEVAGKDWNLQLGPVAVVNLNRTNRDAIADRRVRALGEIDTAVEVGGYAGIAKTGIIHDFDTLAISLSYRHDVTRIHRSGVWTPTVNYTTPLSTKALVTLFASSEIIGDRYARTYFGVTPAGSVASGLPAFRPEGGQKDISFGGMFTHAITGNLTKGLALVAGGSYKKLVGDVADSPLVTIAGTRHQWTAGAGLALTF
ncbi:outer membrane scaffolding protein for murein synthesis (MipA/OmpV family) [Sphingomonas sp. BE123]|uniref:MipA/OmpV family protein n=1 Tax=unclassified Sphingomonas TaxID=196159 RepID=UPI0028604089|nr:MipA/OmpV family protein [Sphingomonas sp. BE123]MDR6852622.1 outer membrane scaffolding protein for murein synthesis (MipA/OmpV family) [Sphingomonas sp. BE123]